MVTGGAASLTRGHGGGVGGVSLTHAESQTLAVPVCSTNTPPIIGAAV